MTIDIQSSPHLIFQLHTHTPSYTMMTSFRLIHLFFLVLDFSDFNFVLMFVIFSLSSSITNQVRKGKTDRISHRM
jgi:hypothetical protein